MRYGGLAAEYRCSAALLRERELHLGAQPAGGTREERHNLQERMALLRNEYNELMQIANYLERCERERSCKCK